MKKIETLLMAEYEARNHQSFFCMVDTVFSGVLLRQHILKVLRVKSCSPLPRWVRLGLMQKSHFAHATLYSLTQCKALGIKSMIEITSSLVLRSSMRMEYFLSLGIDTPEKIMAYVVKGNNCSIQGRSPSTGLLSRYEAALKEKGINIPDLAGPLNEAALKRLTYREIYIDRLSLTGNTLCPHMVYLNFRNDNVPKMARNIVAATKELEAIFCVPGQSLTVAPDFTICTFREEDGSQDRQAREIYQKANLPAYWGRDNWLSFKSFPNPFPYLPPQNLL